MEDVLDSTQGFVYPSRVGGKEQFPQRVQLVQDFWKMGMWRDDALTYLHPVLRSLCLVCARSLYIVVEAFRRERIRLQAAALTFFTLLSLVPLLAVAFSLFTAFGGLETVGERVKDLVVDALAVQQRDVVTKYLDQFVEGANAGGLGAFGSVTLFVTAVSALTSIERAFNEIWGVTEARTWLRRIQVYLPLVTIGPVLFGVALSSIVAAEGSDYVRLWMESTPGMDALLGLGPVLLYTALFFGLYAFMPNTRVPVAPALVGGFVAAVCWVAAQRIVTIYMGRAISYSAIYGSFGVVPITILWIYISWTLVLLGATVSFAVQSAGTYKPERPVSVREREQIATSLMMVAAKRYVEGKGGCSVQDLVAVARVSSLVGRRLLDELADGGLLMKVVLADEDTGYIPSRPLETISLGDVIGVLRGSLDTSQVRKNFQTPGLELLRAAADMEQARLKQLSLADLLELRTGTTIQLPSESPEGQQTAESLSVADSEPRTP